MHVLTLAAILLLTAARCLAQEPGTWSWNVQGALLLPAGTGSFTSIDGVPTPGGLRYDPRLPVSSPQVAIGVDASLPAQFRIGGRVRYAPVTLLYRANERVPIANPDGTGVITATIAHELEAHTTDIDVVPYLRYEALSWLAAEVAVPIVVPIQSRYQQRMYIADPDGLPFIDGSLERITGQGAIPSLSIAALAVQGRIEGIIPITPSGVLSLTPFVAVQQMITAPASNGALRSTVFSAGIGLRSTFHAGTEAAMAPTATPRRVIVKRDTTVELSRLAKQVQTLLMNRTVDSAEINGVQTVTIREAYTTFYPKPPAILRVSMRLAFEHNDGSVSDDASLLARRVRSTHVVQLLPIVVYDGDAAVLPQRYVRLSPAEVPTWKVSGVLQDAPSHWQYNIHNIVGSRLRSSRGVCSVIAYHDGTQQGKVLAEQRAQSLRQYLRETFGIDEKRLPVRYVRADGVLGGCVGFDPENVAAAPITSTQMINDTELPIVRVIPDVASEAGVERWAVTVQTNGRTVREISDGGALPKFIPWNMNADLQSEARQQDVEIHLEVVDRDSSWSRSEPATIRLRSQAATDRTMMAVERTDYLDMSAAVDGLLLPALERRDAVRINVRVGDQPWFVRGLAEPELSIYLRATLWRKQERRP